jgi:hypothetical protein
MQKFIITIFLPLKYFSEHYDLDAIFTPFFQIYFMVLKNGQKKCPKSKNLFPIWRQKV